MTDGTSLRKEGFQPHSFTEILLEWNVMLLPAAFRKAPFAVLFLSVLAYGQSTVTTSGGATGSVPVYSGTSMIANSSITESNGNVGIGLSNPTDRFAIQGTSSGQPGILLFGDYASSTPAIRLYKWSGSANNYHAWRSMVDSDGAYNVAYAFTPNGIGGVEDYAPRFRILGNGNVGIGTSTPDTRLTVATSGGSSPFGAMSIDVTTFSSIANASASYFFQVRDIGGGSTPFYIRGDGNTGIGTSSPSTKLEVNGSVKLTPGSGASMTYPDGTVQSTAWNGTTCGGDYAESVDVTGDRTSYEPGDVLVIDPKLPGNFLRAAKPYSKLVAGIYSTKPGLTGRRQGAPTTGEEVPMAMLGIVPTKVSTENGAIEPGDLLVTSSTNGYAMKGTDMSKMMGSVIGKAIGYLDKGTGVIEVLVSLQ